MRRRSRHKVSHDMVFGAVLVSLSFALPPSVGGEDTRLPLPERTAVHEVWFDAPGCGGFTCFRQRDSVDSIFQYFQDRRTGWKRDFLERHGEFLVSLRLEEGTSFDVRAGRSRDRAYLTAETSEGNSQFREITVPELSHLLELCQCDLSVAYLQRDRGYYGSRITKVLDESAKFAAKMDKLGFTHATVDTHKDRAHLLRLLDAILEYSRSNPQDAETAQVLRRLDIMNVRPFVPKWHSVRLTGCGYHLSVQIIVGENGPAMPATPKNCLAVALSEYGDLEKLPNARRLCTKVLEGSDRGTIIGRADEIPGYHDKPLSPENERKIRPFYGLRKGEQLLYGFYVYERIGGRVGKCTLTVQGATASWEMHDVARDIGAASYIK